MVEVEMVEVVMELMPVRVVLPPWRARVLLFRFKVPVPVLKVLPLTVVKVGVAVKVIWVEVPIRTLCPPVIERLEEETVREASVLVPVPPLPMPTTPEVIWLPLMAMEVLEAAVINPLPLTVKVGTEEADPQLPVLVLTVARVKAPALLNVASPLKVLKTGVPPDPAWSSWPEVPTAAKTWEEPLPSMPPLLTKVEDPVPPLPTGRMPITSEVPKPIAPLNN